MITRPRRPAIALASAFAVALLMCAAPASANENVVSRTVSLHGLNLAAPADLAALRQELRSAAGQVCRDAGYEDSPDCQNDAFHRAWASLATRIAGAKDGMMTADARRVR